MSWLQAFNYGEVQLREAYCEHAFEKEKAYLKSLELDRLLVGFRKTAGLKVRAKRYLGWESTEIQGHTLGHYLSALAQAEAYDHDPVLEEKLIELCKGLQACQREDGYLFASPEVLFDKVEQHQPAWVPWYTLHKLLSGLILTYELTKLTLAYEIAKGIGNWVYQRCQKWSPELRDQVLSVEYGGMNESLYELYLLSGKKEYLFAAHQFDEMPLFEKLYKGQDVLNGLHANATIPKVIGALKRYVVTDNKYFLKVAENFWEMVVRHHSYVTGGNSEWEHFGLPDVLEEERTACNCETCNTYNMLKLSQLLFEITKESKYANFYEKAWINAILASQNPETGMTTYFQPMATGYFKVYSRPYDQFWCCTGTGMENFTKLSEGIFYHSEQALYINRYISAHLNWKEKGLSLSMVTHFPDLSEVSLNYETKEPILLYLVLPNWAGDLTLTANGQPISYEVKEGYGVVTIHGKGCLKLNLPMTLHYESLPDAPCSVAFMYGPIVLSALLGDEMMDTTVTGVDVTVPLKDFFIKDYILLEKISPKAWLKNLDQGLVKEEGSLSFKLCSKETELRFVPHYSQYKQRYGIYWKLYEKGGAESKLMEKQQREKWQRLTQNIDCIPIGNDQYELAHHIKGKDTEVGSLKGHRCRWIKEDGWFEYEVKVKPEGCYLNIGYCNEDLESCFEIRLNGTSWVKERLTQAKEDFYTKRYALTAEDLRGCTQVVLRFQTSGSFCRVFDELFISE